MTPLKQVRIAILPALALAAWGVTIWVETLRGINVDRDDRCPSLLAIVFSVWALIDHYYRKLNRDRQQAHAGHDVDLLAKGVAAFAHQEEADGRGQSG